MVISKNNFHIRTVEYVLPFLILAFLTLLFFSFVLAAILRRGPIRYSSSLREDIFIKESSSQSNETILTAFNLRACWTEEGKQSADRITNNSSSVSNTIVWKELRG